MCSSTLGRSGLASRSTLMVRKAGCVGRVVLFCVGGSGWAREGMDCQKDVGGGQKEEIRSG